VLTCQEFGGDLDAGRRADFQAVNRVLGSTQPLVRRELLTGPFAALDLHAADPTRSPRSWGALFEARARPGISQLQFAVAGMNAHINFDLARSLVLTCQEFGGDLDAGRRADFQAVNRVLGSTQPLVRRELLTGAFATLDQALGEHDDRVSMWGIEAAREFAWSTAQTLWAIRGTPVEDTFTRGLDRMVELTSRLILQGGPPTG
jgi:hypothetical protein